MTPDRRSPLIPRRELDRHAYLEHRRAAVKLRAAAKTFEDLAGDVLPDPDLGSFSEDAATAVRRGHVATSLALLDLAARAEAHSQEYRAFLLPDEAEQVGA